MLGYKGVMPLSAHDIRRPSLVRVFAPLRAVRDQYFVSRVLLVTGLLAAALLMFERIVQQVGLMLSNPDLVGLVALSDQQRFGALAIAMLALGGALQFVRAQRMELQRNRIAEERIQAGLSADRIIAASVTDWRRFRDAVAVRTGLSAICIYAASMMMLVARGADGFSLIAGMGPLVQAVILGYAMLVGLLVSVVTLLGVRTLLALKAMFGAVNRRYVRPFVAWRRRGFSDSPSYRDLYGSALLSRGPPAGHAAA